MYGDIVQGFFIVIKEPNIYDVDGLSFNEAIDNVSGLEDDLLKMGTAIDGVIIENIYDSPLGNKKGKKANTYCVYYQNDIKLADGTNVKFDSSSDNVRFKNGGLMENKLLAPNGKPSNLTPEQYKLVRTSEFKHWFGDFEKDPKNSSKAVDDNGEPLVVYHGTRTNFTEFNINSVSSNTGNFGHYGYGFYFSDDSREAKSYGDIILTCFLNFRNPFTWNNENIILLKENGVYWIDDLEDVSFDRKDLIKKVSEISIPASELLNSISERGYEIGWQNWLKKYNVNDYEIDFNDISNLLDDSYIEHNKEYLKSIGVRKVKTIKDFPYEQSLHWITDLGERSKEVTEIILNLGFDSIIYGSEYIAFKPNQIKLADGTNTTFDLSSNDIRFEYGGSVLLAPNGKPSNLTPEQHKLVRTPEFKSWFGDFEKDPENSSKVVDENGEPLVVYHGTNYLFNKFKDESSAYYFAVDEKYANYVIDTYKGRRPYSRVIPVFINIKNIHKPKFKIEKNEVNYFLNSHLYLKLLPDGLVGFEDVDDDDDDLKELINKNIKTKVFVVFEPNQIKLADGTNSTFDSSSDDIRFEQGGETESEIPDYLKMFLGK